MTDQTSARVSVRDVAGQDHHFASTGIDEDYVYLANDYTGELLVERVSYGPRGNDEWARLGSTVIAAWPADRWQSVTLYNSAVAADA